MSNIKKKLEKFIKGGKEDNEPSPEKSSPEKSFLEQSKQPQDEDGAVAQLMGDCSSCFRDTKELLGSILNFHNSNDKSMAEQYCENHNTKYIGHKCKPHWCGDCGFHIKYVVEIDHAKV